MRPIRDPERVALKHLLAACDLKGKRVLEIGCGDGVFTRQYARRAAWMAGLDVDTEEVKIAAEKSHPTGSSRAAFLAGEGEHLPFEAGAFDIALFALSL